MTLRYSTGCRNYQAQHGSLKQALQNGKLQIYSGGQPSTADAAPTGTLLATITANSGTHTPEVLSSATFTLTGTSGGVATLTVNSIPLLDAAVPFNVSLTQTAADLAAAINLALSAPDYIASASGASVTIKALRGSGTRPNGFALAATYTGDMGGVSGSLAGGVAAVNGLRFGSAAGGSIGKDPAQVWSGVAAAAGAAGWFRYVGSVADSGATDSAESEIRVDGAIATSGAQINMSSTTIAAGATQTVAVFNFTLPAA